MKWNRINLFTVNFGILSSYQDHICRTCEANNSLEIGQNFTALQLLPMYTCSHIRSSVPNCNLRLDWILNRTVKIINNHSVSDDLQSLEEELTTYCFSRDMLHRNSINTTQNGNWTLLQIGSKCWTALKIINKIVRIGSFKVGLEKFFFWIVNITFSFTTYLYIFFFLILSSYITEYITIAYRIHEMSHLK